MLRPKISPSMMCADLTELKSTVRVFEEAGIEYLHVDIMDGDFVPNFTLGVEFCEALRSITNIPLDLHLMIEKPENKLDWFRPRPGEIVSIHTESTAHLQRALAKIRSFGAKAYAAVNPGTAVSVLEDVSEDLDGVLVMTVNPGFAGQKLVASTLPKITRLRDFLDGMGCGGVSIEVDGNVSFENARKMRAAGADIFVGGSSSVFSREGDLKDNILRLRQGLQTMEETV